MYTNKDYCKYMVAGIGNNNEYLLRLAQAGSRVNTVPASVSSPVTPKTTESPVLNPEAVIEVAKSHSGQVPAVNPSVAEIQTAQPEAVSVSKDVALGIFSKPKYSAAEAYNKSLVASQYPSAVTKKVVDNASAPKSDSYTDLLSGADYTGLGFNGGNNIYNKKLYIVS